MEEAIANNSLNVFDGDYNEFHCFELANMSEERFKSICDLYGLTINGKIKPIQPDLLAEYFYIRYSDRFVGTTLKQSFWLPLFRDFNYLLTTKYRNVMKRFFPYCLNSLGLYYIEGIYEAFCTTNSDDERLRLLALAENYEEDFKEWVGNDPIIHPSGNKATLDLFDLMHGRTISIIVHIMTSYIVYKDILPEQYNNLPIQKYDMYDSIVNHLASRLFVELLEFYNNKENSLPFIDKLNELTKLYEDNKGRNNEVEFYYIKGLHLAKSYFFNDYENELALPLFIELIDLYINEKNAVPFIDKLYELTKLYEDNKEKDNEVAIYYAMGLHSAIKYFFNSSYEYEDELASQMARVLPAELRSIYQVHNNKEILKIYIDSLLVLYKNDRHEFYKKKEDILIEIEEIKKEYNS